MAERLGAVPVAVERLTGGVSAEVLGIDLRRGDGAVQRVVLRAHPTANLPQEHRLLEVMRGTDVPVPAPLLVDPTCTVHPTPYLLMARVEGHSVLRFDVTSVRHLAALLAIVHAVPVDAVAGLALPAREDPVAELPRYLPAGLTAPGGKAPPFDAAVCHGDFWPGNVLWRDGQVVALIDWEDSAIGDPLSDVSACRLELWYDHAAAVVDAFTEHYLALTGRSRSGIAAWDAFVSAAALSGMADWGLPPEREGLMRRRGTSFLHKALAARRT